MKPAGMVLFPLLLVDARECAAERYPILFPTSSGSVLFFIDRALADL